MRTWAKKIIVCVGLGLVFAMVAQCKQYCANIVASQASGAVGQVALQILDGVSTYSFNLDLNSFKNSTPCDLQDGLKFHVHSYWNSNTNNSAANEMCGSSYTGGHYDPNFACSTSSQSYSTQCTELGRIPPTYEYSCNTTNYGQGKYSMCEVGDISGKYGVVYPKGSKNLQYSVTNFEDYLPPYTYNYLRQDSTSLMWTSFVFHCAQNSNRLVCAKFSTSEFAPCTDSFSAMSSSTSSSNKSGYSAGDIAAAVLVPSFVLFLVGAGLGFFCFQKNGGLLKTTNRA